MSSKNTAATASSPFHYPLSHSLPFTFQQQHHHHFAAAAATLASPLPSPALSAHDALNPWASISIINGGVNTAALTAPSTTLSPTTTPSLSAAATTASSASTSTTSTTTGVVPPSSTTTTTAATTTTTTTTTASSSPLPIIAKGVYANHFSTPSVHHHTPSLSSSPPTVTSQQHLLPPVSVPSQNPSSMPSSTPSVTSTASSVSPFASTFCGPCKSKLTKAHKIMPYSNREAMLEDLCNKCKKHCYALSLSIAVPTVAVTPVSAPVAPIHHSLENSTISFDGSSQHKNVINDVFLSTSMLHDDADFYLHETSSSVFDSDSDSGLASPPTQSAPVTPMTPFLEHDEDQLYGPEATKHIHDDDLLHSENDDDVADAVDQQQHDPSMVVDMKRPMFIPVSICDPRDFSSMAGCLPTPPETNARKHSYDFLRQSEGLFPGGLAAIKRRRMVSVDMMGDAPASPPASTAGDDETELSDADSQGFSFNAFRRKSIFHQSFRQLTPTSPSLSSDTPCFAPTASADDDDSDAFELHPELAESEDESEDESNNGTGLNNDNSNNNSGNHHSNHGDNNDVFNSGNNADTRAGSFLDSAIMPTDVFIAPQESAHGYLSDDHFSFSEADEYDDEDDQHDEIFVQEDIEEQSHQHTEGDMEVDAMSSSDESDSDMSDMEDDQFQVKRRGTWHGPSLAMKESASAAALAWIPEPETFRQKIHARIAKQASKNNNNNASTTTTTTTKASKASSTRRAASPATTASAKASAAAAAAAAKADAADKADKVEEKPTKASSAAATEKKEAAPAASTNAEDEKSSSTAKSTKPLTLFQILTKANIDWCRYCGTTEGVNWRPGPWGKRTLCNKHGCDFKGYGFACKLPRLDLTSYAHETVEQRIRPVLQHFCHGCQSQESVKGNLLVRCEGCPKAFHQKCHGETMIPDSVAMAEDGTWFCDESCRENIKKRRVCVELPKKRLPLMSTPKPNSPANAAAAAAGGAGGNGAAGSASSSSASEGNGRSRASRASITSESTSRK
ncbi:hypothetical protein BGW41_002495 [Actinomortierella wolfii]|nr:hypothetical protein BGW41_002495 [Actinomortierella wolfii]